MSVKSQIGFANQLPIKALFTPAGLIAGDEQDGSAPMIERKSHAPHTIFCIETHLLHVGMMRVFQCVYARSAKLWPNLL